MSWIRQHVNYFVIPGIRTLAKADGLAVLDRDIKPFDVRTRPSTKCPYTESGLIYATVASVLPKENKTREIALELCRVIGTKDEEKLVYSLETRDTRVKQLTGSCGEGISGSAVIHSMLCQALRSLKRRLTHKDSFVVYPGRDAWAFEVLSRRRGMRSLYDPSMSRWLAENKNDSLMRQRVQSFQLPWQRALVFDTGYAGTVPKAIGRAAGLDPVTMIMLSAMDPSNQLFPRHTGSRAKALSFEYVAKYRQRCTAFEDGKPIQYLADLEEFIKAGILTIWLWYHQSPRRVESYKETWERRSKRPKKRNSKKTSATSTHQLSPARIDWLQQVQQNQLWQTNAGFLMGSGGITTASTDVIIATANASSTIPWGSIDNWTGV